MSSGVHSHGMRIGVAEIAEKGKVKGQALECQQYDQCHRPCHRQAYLFLLASLKKRHATRQETITRGGLWPSDQLQVQRVPSSWTRPWCSPANGWTDALGTRHRDSEATHLICMYDLLKIFHPAFPPRRQSQQDSPTE